MTQDKQFVNGFSVKTITTQYGDILNCGINLKSIKENDSKNGWVNFSIKKAKSGNWYAEMQEARD